MGRFRYDHQDVSWPAAVFGTAIGLPVGLDNVLGSGVRMAWTRAEIAAAMAKE